jgi:hypothetical protein
MKTRESTTLRSEFRMWGCDAHKLYLLGRARRLIWRAKPRVPHKGKVPR